MHRRIWLLFALSGSLAWGQGISGSTATGKAPQDDDKNSSSQADSPATAVAMDAPVLTIKGFCPDHKATASGAACETVITRAQFEQMATAIRPNLSASVKQQLASLYPRLLVMSQKAEELGIDKQAPYEEMIAFSRMQILNQGLTRKLQQDSVPVSDQEIADYYQKNPEIFEQYTLQRLVVPLRPPGVDAKRTETQPAPAKKMSEQELTDLAQALRTRAAAGEDFVKLQREAFDAAGVKVESPNTNLGKVRRSALPANQTAIFELKVGEVSQVISDAGGHYIYKLEAKDRLTLDEARAEIRQTLQNQRSKEAIAKIQASYTTETNDAYFAVSPSKSAK